jgi:hypothetical protein
VKLTGTLWRVKPDAPAMWGNITDRPAHHTEVINNAVNMMGCIRPGDTILVISERKRFSGMDIYSHLESVQVATPVPGWCNATYFTSESIWLERIA